MIGLHLKVYGPVCLKLGVTLDITEFYFLSDLDLHSRSQESKKVKASLPVVFLIKFTSFILFSSCQIVF